MLRILTGRFHPDLEDRLVTEVSEAKRADPFAPLAIVVPSRVLVGRLRDRLVREESVPLMHVQFWTFYQLALRLRDEALTRGAARLESDIPLAVSEFFFQALVARLTRRLMPELPPGAAAALWATLRDLKDSAVDPDAALRAVIEGVFEREDASLLTAVFTMLGALESSRREAGVGTMDDLTAAVTDLVPRSDDLAAFRHIYYYGFYDLTQVQLALFEAVCRAAPVTVFFPLDESPTSAFARRFYEREILSLAGASDRAVSNGTAACALPIVQRITTVGAADELAFVCKEIWQLVEDHAYRFEDIGVVSRSLDGYEDLLRPAFDRHRIPFTTTAGTAAGMAPVIKTLVQLAALPGSGFPSAPMLEVLTAPVYRAPERRSAREIPAELWRSIANERGVRREADWLRLAAAPERAGEGLWELAAGLIEDCRRIPSGGTASELTEAFAEIAARHLTIGGLDGEPADDDPIGTVVAGALAEMRQLDRLGGTLTWPEWRELWERVLDQARIPVSAGRHGGVQVLDAMAARGVPFRALFVLGLNEKGFPRFIREDAFLRDRHRRVLEETLGYKIDQKLAGYDEERLLFHLLVQSARHRLYLLWHRADEAGRPLAPSGYLADAVALPGSATIALPRRLLEREALPQFARHLLVPDELAEHLIAAGQHPGAVLPDTGRDPAVFEAGIEAIRELDGPNPLGPYDGAIGPLESWWTAMAARGFSPTTVESYARCPFQYLLRHVLRLSAIREPADVEPTAQIVGQLLHATLRLAGERLIAAGWPAVPCDRVRLHEEAAAATGAAAAQYAAEHGMGYPLLWELMLETVTYLTAASLAMDEQDFQQTGYRPMAFEADAEGRLDGLSVGPLRLRGRLDRIDTRVEPPGFRILDYKYKLGNERKSHERDLLLAAVRGFRLQPPLYSLCLVDGGHPNAVAFRYLTATADEPVEEAVFDAGAWTGPAAERLRATLDLLFGGVKAGRFFMLPDETYCKHCEMASACRRLHVPSWWRSYGSPTADALRKLRRVEVPSE